MAWTRETLNLKSTNKGLVVIDQILQHLAVHMLRHHPKTIEYKRRPLLFISTASRDRIRWLPGRPLKVAIAWRTGGDGFAGAGIVHVGTGFDVHGTLRDDFSGPLLPHQIVLHGGAN
ncbi:hypothetical protein [Burkholderia cepacia]|uniref:hypothetical protein n=1 Tax=Burkholderia cepacia TaxID=292 RepID=UPI0018C58D2B|nr:hypothetical protein [Burkholderia cepacia]